MTEPGTPRVAVYLDFDNIVISRYDQVHGRNAFQKDKTAGFHKQPGRLTEATVDVGAIIDFASSFGTLVLTKAYADWSADVNADYRGPAGRPRGRSRSALPGRRVRQERGRYPVGGRRCRGHVQVARPDPRGHRRRRLRLHRAGPALQAPRPLRRRHRHHRLDQQVADGRVRRVRHLRRAARRARPSPRRPPRRRQARQGAGGRRGARHPIPRRRPPACWNGRCGSATRRTTRTGCTTRRSRPR